MQILQDILGPLVMIGAMVFLAYVIAKAAIWWRDQK
jgi:hypothetical protein